MTQRLLRTAIVLSLAALSSPLLHADQWTEPTKEELSMTSQPEVPGAAAVYLTREEITQDKLHVWSVYTRLKVLTEKGKEYANVELNYRSTNGGGGYTVSDIAGRTIHPDGTVIPFTGKPYEKLIEKTQGYGGVKYMAKVFTMPDVEVGSIIEYRYTLRYDDHYYMSPDWFIQSELYMRKGHYTWKPTSATLVIKREGREQLSNGISWFPVLPKGAEVKMTRLPPAGLERDGQLIFDLNISDVPPSPREEYMPPIGSFSYRVLFFYSAYRSSDEFWKSEAKYWAKQSDKFIGPGPKVSTSVQVLTSPSDTQDQKLHKIYNEVMKLENTDFTRTHDRAEDKATGLHDIHSTDDIIERKRGSGDQLAQLFVAMARAAGMKAYLFSVTNRGRSIFTPAYLNMAQLDDNIAVVNVDGKERFFDPGSRYCPYGHLAWQHTFTGGVRQIDGGAEISQTPGEPYTFSRTQRVADLTMDEHGEVTGIVKMTYMGSPALTWRKRSLEGDTTSFNHELQTDLERLLPGGVEVKVGTIQNLDAYEEPLVVNYTIKGPIGAPTGKRLFLPADIFVSTQKATFPHEKRDVAVDFNYPRMVQDAMRIKLPSNIKVETVPAKDRQQLQDFALYTFEPQSSANSVTVRRNVTIGEFLFLPKEYPELRAFYNKLESKDQENIVVTAGPAAAATAAASSN